MHTARNGRVVVVAALVVGLGALLLWYAGRDASYDEIESTGHAPSTSEPGDALGGPALKGLPDGRGRPTPAQQPWILEVRVQGLPADARPPLKVSVMPIGERGERYGHEIQVVEEQVPDRAELDVTAAVIAGTSLRVRVWPVDAFPQGQTVELPHDRKARERGGRLIAEILVPAAAVLEGRVVGPMGMPVKLAYVAVDAAEAPRDDHLAVPLRIHAGHGPTDPKALRKTGFITQEDGRFSVLASGPQQVVLVAGWSSDGAPTVSRPISIQVGTRHDVGDLVLGPEEHLRGRVVGVEQRFGRGLKVEATRLGAHRQLFETLSRTPTGAAPTRVHAAVDDRGGFEIQGIDGAPWLMVANAETWEYPCSHEVRRRASALVLGPTEGVTLDVRRALLRVHVSDQRGPLDGALVLVEGDEVIAFRTLDRGKGGVVLLPETTYRVLAWRSDRGVDRRTVTLGPSGTVEELRLRLPADPAPIPSELSWVPKDDDARIGLYLEAPDAPTRERPPLPDAEVQVQVRVSVEGLEGTRLPATLRLLDAQSHVVPTTWLERSGMVTWLVKGAVQTWGELWLTTQLAPGDYVLVVEVPHHRTQRELITIGPDGSRPSLIEMRMVPR